MKRTRRRLAVDSGGNGAHDGTDRNGGADPHGANGTDATATLVRRAQAGDALALECLVTSHLDSLRRFSRRLMANPDSAEDLAQEALLRAIESLPHLGAPYRFGPWLLGIAANLARRRWQRPPRWHLSVETLAETYPDVIWQGWGTHATRASPEAAFEEAEQTRRLQEALGSLPQDLARVLALHYLEGLSYAEIAASLDVPLSTVKGRLFKSRSRLLFQLDRLGLAARLPAKHPDPDSRRRYPMTTETPTPGTRAHGGALVPAYIASIRKNQLAPQRIVVLQEEGGERLLRVIVGIAEADAMAVKLLNQPTPRPLPHDLMASLVAASGVTVERVAITALHNQTFFASVHVRRGRGRTVELDSRPSDALCLALRTGCPILVDESLLALDQPLKHGPTLEDLLEGPDSAHLDAAARDTLVRAGDEARALNHGYVGTEHILVALLAGPEDPATRPLRDTGVTLDAARAEVEALVGRGDLPVTRPLVLAARVPALLERAAEEARSLGHQLTRPEHLLVAIAADPENLASRVIATIRTRHFQAHLREDFLQAIRAA